MKSITSKWVVLALLCGAYFFHQVDRAIFGVLTPLIQADLGLNDIQIGWVNTALFWTLAAMTMVAGFAGDCCSRKWLITISLIFWSLTTGLTGLSTGFASVMFFRSIATGVGESFYGPSAMSLLASHHADSRSRAFSIHQAALYIGLMTSGLLAAVALMWLGSWRLVFALFGVAGLFLGLVFVPLLHDDHSSPRVRNRSHGVPLIQGLRAFFVNPSALCATTGFVAIVFVNNAYLSWAPKFMSEKFGTDVKVAGSQMMFWHHLCAFVAILLGGIISDRFVRKYPRFRLGFQIGSLLLGAPCLLMIGFSPSSICMLGMTAAYGIFRGCFEVNTHASVFDVVPAEYRSTVVGCMIMSAFFFGGLSGVFMGALKEYMGVYGFEIGFAVMGAAYLIAAMVMSISFFFTFYKNRVKDI